MTTRLCAECKQPIPSGFRPNRIYCGERCARAKSRRAYREHNPKPILRCTADTGAVSELLVAADLLKRGYEVFRAVSAGATCDMLALKNGTSLRIQVKTAYRTRKGRIAVHCKDESKHDHLAAVIVPENLIVYSPDI